MGKRIVGTVDQLDLQVGDKVRLALTQDGEVASALAPVMTVKKVRGRDVIMVEDGFMAMSHRAIWRVVERAPEEEIVEERRYIGRKDGSGPEGRGRWGTMTITYKKGTPVRAVWEAEK